MVKKGTPARVEPAGSFLPVVPEEEQQDPGEAAGSAAATPTAASQVEGAEAAGSAAARPPRGREGRGRAGKSVNRKEDRKVYYEAQDLYRQYWGVRQTSRIKYEDATREYCAELLDFYNWHYSCGPYAAAEEFDEEVPAGSEQPEGAGSAASAEVATDRVVETGSEVLESGTASTVVLTPRQPEGPPPGFVSGATSQSRRPASPPVRRRRSRTSSAPATDRVAGRAAPSEAPRASSVGPVVGQVEGGHRRRRRTSDRRGRAEEGRDVARKPPSPPTERSRSTEVARRRERRQRPVVEQVAGIPAAVPDQETPPTYRIDRRGVWKLIRPAEGVAPTQRLVEVRPEGAGQAAPAGAEEDPHELADEAWVSPTGGQHRVERRGDNILIHRGTAVHDLTTGDNAILREAFAEGEIIEAQPVEPTPKRSATIVAPEPKRQRRNYTFFEDRDRSKRPQTWFGDPDIILAMGTDHPGVGVGGVKVHHVIRDVYSGARISYPITKRDIATHAKNLRHFLGIRTSDKVSHVLVKHDEAQELEQACVEVGLVPETSLPNRWPHNAKLERDIREEKECTRAIHLQSGLPYSFHTFSFPFACFSLSFDRVDEETGKTQWEMLTRAPFLGRRLCFGQLCYYRKKTPTKRTLEPNMSPALFLGWRVDSGGRYRNVVKVLDYQDFRIRGLSQSIDVPEPELYVED